MNRYGSFGNKNVGKGYMLSVWLEARHVAVTAGGLLGVLFSPASIAVQNLSALVTSACHKTDTFKIFFGLFVESEALLYIPLVGD